MKRLSAQLAHGLARLAASRMRHRHPDWSAAMLAEAASIPTEGEKLVWAIGLIRAALGLRDLVYPLALLLSILAMTLYQWSADENLMTLLVLSLLALAMGFLRPRHFLLSGVVVGAVVAAVNGFETASGIRPAYEAYHSLSHDLKWLALLIPAVASSATGRQIHLKLIARHK